VRRSRHPDRAGGPGTGKTAVALHRAAYLLYSYRKRLGSQGVLLVGPSSIFLRYIDEVLRRWAKMKSCSPRPSLKPTVRVSATAPLVRNQGRRRMARDRRRSTIASGDARDVNVPIDGYFSPGRRRDSARSQRTRFGADRTTNVVPNRRLIVDHFRRVSACPRCRARDRVTVDDVTVAALSRARAGAGRLGAGSHRALRRAPEVRGARAHVARS
jgi:hypothetical protein